MLISIKVELKKLAARTINRKIIAKITSKKGNWWER